MADKIVQLGASDYPDLTAMLDRAFAKPPDRSFAIAHTALYQPCEALMRCNYAIRRGGALAAVVGLFPITWQLGKAQLSVAGVGGVAVAPQFRRQGLMVKLMDHVRDRIVEQGYQLSYLGGNRHRYRYFGWERAGTMVLAHISKACIQHTFGRAEPLAVELEELAADPAVNSKLKSLHDRQPAYCRRPADRFDQFLTHWGNRPVVARDRGGRIVGYAVQYRDQTQIVELAGDDDDAAVHIIRALADKSEQHEIAISVDQLAMSLRRRIGEFAEAYVTTTAGNWQVFDWPAVISALLAYAQKQTSLAPASVVVGIDDLQIAIRLTVDDQRTECQVTDDKPDINGDGATILRLLLGPLAPRQVMAIPRSASILESWCPLPLALAVPDHV